MSEVNSQIDPVLDLSGVVERFHEWGITDVSERYVRHLWETGELPSRILKRKRRIRQSAVDSYIQVMTATKL